MKLKDKRIGAKVIVRSITVEINPQVGWKTIKNVPGRIVRRKPEHEHYYHSCSGGYTWVKKFIINGGLPAIAVKLDNGVVDVEGNNTIVVYEYDVIFSRYTPKNVVSYSEYRKALKVVKQYENQKSLL